MQNAKSHSIKFDPYNSLHQKVVQNYTNREGSTLSMKNISTTVNLNSKQNTLGTIEAQFNNFNNFDPKNSKNLKKEIFQEHIPISPKNIQIGGDPKTMTNRSLIKVYPRISVEDKKPDGQNIIKNNHNETRGSILHPNPRISTTSCSTSRIINHKKLTLKQIENEQKFLKDFISNHFHNQDESFIYKNLGTNKNRTIQHQRLQDARAVSQEALKALRNNTNNTCQTNSYQWKDFAKSMKNPALGPQYIEQRFPHLYQKQRYSLLADPQFENKFKKNYSKKYLGSVLLAQRVGKLTDDSNKYENVKNNKFTQVSKLKMKWKTIKWLIDNKKDTLDRLMAFQENILNISNKKTKEFDRGLTKKEFIHVMKSNGISKDVDLINKLFWVFDEDGDNDLKYKEIAFGIEMFRDSSIEKKLKVFFDMCDVDGSGSISKAEFSNLLQKNIINNDIKSSMKQVVDKIFNSVILDQNGEITFEKLKEACQKNSHLSDIIDKNLMALKSIDNIIDNDIKNDLMRFNPDVNDQLRTKLLNLRVSYIPLRDGKFNKLIEDFVSNKEKLIEFNKQREENKDEDDSLEEQADEDSVFREEKEMVEMFSNIKK
jgi:Ca2+-binding EF-hand superfamily protein